MKGKKLLEGFGEEYQIADALNELEIELERYAKKYFGITFQEVYEVPISEIDDGDSQTVKFLRNLNLKESPTSLYFELLQDMKVAIANFNDAADHLKDEKDGLTLRAIVETARSCGRIGAYERIPNIARIAKARSDQNRKNATLHAQSKIMGFVVEKIAQLPIGKKINFSAAVNHLAPQICKFAEDVGSRNRWVENMVYKRLSTWAEEEEKFKKKIKQALAADPSNNLFHND